MNNIIARFSSRTRIQCTCVPHFNSVSLHNWSRNIDFTLYRLLWKHFNSSYWFFLSSITSGNIFMHQFVLPSYYINLLLLLNSHSRFDVYQLRILRKRKWSSYVFPGHLHWCTQFIQIIFQMKGTHLKINRFRPHS